MTHVRRSNSAINSEHGLDSQRTNKITLIQSYNLYEKSSRMYSYVHTINWRIFSLKKIKPWKKNLVKKKTDFRRHI